MILAEERKKTNQERAYGFLKLALENVGDKNRAEDYVRIALVILKMEENDLLKRIADSLNGKSEL